MEKSKVIRSEKLRAVVALLTFLGFLVMVPSGQVHAGKVIQKRIPKGLDVNAGASKGQAAVDFGKTVSGRLDSDDELLPSDNSLYDTWIINGKKGDLIVVRGASDEINPMLVMFSGGTVPAPLTEMSMGTLVFEVPRSGTYLLMVNASEEGESGAYRLRVDRIDPL